MAFMALQNSPVYGVVTVFQDLDIRVYVFAPEKLLRLVYRIFCLAISFTILWYFFGHILNHAYSWD